MMVVIKFKNMKKYLLLFLLIFVLIIDNSCRRLEIDCNRPFTENEIIFIDSLKGTISNNKAEIEINRFNFYYSGDSVKYCSMYITNNYIVNIYNEPEENIKNIHTMRNKVTTIAKQLYTVVVEDSILYWTETFYIGFNSKRIETDTTAFYGIGYNVKIDKRKLENYCGYRIIERGDGFTRDYTIDKTDSLIFEEWSNKIP
jgi:hypothetical protein